MDKWKQMKWGPDAEEMRQNVKEMQEKKLLVNQL